MQREQIVAELSCILAQSRNPDTTGIVHEYRAYNNAVVVYWRHINTWGLVAGLRGREA